MRFLHRFPSWYGFQSPLHHNFRSSSWRMVIPGRMNILKRIATPVLIAVGAIVFWGACPAAADQDPFPFSDAQIVALETSGELLPAADLVATIDADLIAIRVAIPVLSQVHDIPKWVPGEILIRLTAQALDSFLAGDHAELNALNQLYGLKDFTQFNYTPEMFVFFFQDPYNPELLGLEYRKLADVLSTSPNFIFGRDSSITRDEPGHYTFFYGWGDCLSGCLNGHRWVVEVREGSVHLLEESGGPLPAWMPTRETTWGAWKESFSASR